MLSSAGRSQAGGRTEIAKAHIAYMLCYAMLCRSEAGASSARSSLGSMGEQRRHTLARGENPAALKAAWLHMNSLPLQVKPSQDKPRNDEATKELHSTFTLSLTFFLCKARLFNRRANFGFDLGGGRRGGHHHHSRVCVCVRVMYLPTQAGQKSSSEKKHGAIHPSIRPSIELFLLSRSLSPVGISLPPTSS